MYKHFIDDKKAVFFGLDGVVLNTMPYWEEAFKAVATNVGVNLAFYTPAYARRGFTLKSKWETFINNRELNIQMGVEELVAQTENTFINLVKDSDLDVVDGFWEVSAEFKQKNLSLGLVSNTRKPVVDFLLEFTGTRDKIFDVVLSSDGVKDPKPSPEIYKIAANRLNMLPVDILVFEDSIPGATSSIKAGSKTIVIWDGSYAQRDYPSEVVYFFSDFTPLIGSLDKDALELVREFAQTALNEIQDKESDVLRS